MTPLRLLPACPRLPLASRTACRQQAAVVGKFHGIFCAEGLSEGPACIMQAMGKHRGLGSSSVAAAVPLEGTDTSKQNQAELYCKAADTVTSASAPV